MKKVLIVFAMAFLVGTLAFSWGNDLPWIGGPHMGFRLESMRVELDDSVSVISPEKLGHEVFLLIADDARNMYFISLTGPDTQRRSDMVGWIQYVPTDNTNHMLVDDMGEITVVWSNILATDDFLGFVSGILASALMPDKLPLVILPGSTNLYDAIVVSTSIGDAEIEARFVFVPEL